MTTKEFFQKSWGYIVSVLIGLLIGLAINLPSCSKLGLIIEVPVHDTITVDSVRILNKIEWKYKTESDTIVEYINTETNDTVFVPISIPIDHYQYKDTIETDSTSAELTIDYEGYKAKLDSINLVYNYKNKTIITPEQKRIHPFIGLQAGPVVNSGFREVNGAAIELNGGLIFKSGWGIQADYELDALTTGVQHTIKAGFIKQF